MIDFARYPHIRYLIGVDEAGRGPIAGPVAVGVVALPIESALAPGAFRDSKGLPQHKRERQYEELQAKVHLGEMRFSVAQTSAALIDKRGIVWSVNEAMRRALARLAIAPHECLVVLDGGLRAPKQYRLQKTIIRGDEKVYAIALASIAAKVTRDACMRRASWRYPAYGFDQHKGYGTKEHYKVLKQNGACALHRRSFLKGVALAP